MLLLLLLPLSVFAQDITVSGTVTDTQGEPITGAIVIEQGSPQHGTATDLDGNFILRNVSPTAYLVISSMGMRTEIVPINGRTIINVVLEDDIAFLDELVVVGFGVQRREHLSGAVSSVSAEQVRNRPVSSIGQALQGAAANLNITVPSGAANVSPTFNIRGFTSLTGGSPMIVIDGVVSTADVLNRLNAADIENISILKDAAASAIYGSRAAFGVILVTTRGGRDEGLTINYNNSFVWRTITRMPDIITDPYKVMNTRMIMGAPWNNRFTEEELAHARRRSEDPSYSPFLLNPDGTFSYFGQTDWIREAYRRSAMTTGHSIDISGRSDRASYFLSGSYFFQDGMIRYGTDKYHRYNLRSRLDFQLTDNWKLGSNLNLIVSDYDAPRWLGSDYFWAVNRRSPLSTPRNPDGTWTRDGAYVLGRLEEGGRRRRENVVLTTQLNTRLDLIRDVFFINGVFSHNIRSNKDVRATLPVSYYIGPELPPRLLDPVTSARGDSYRATHTTFDVFGTFTRSFDRHAVTALLGFNQEEYRFESMMAERQNLISPSLPSWALATGEMGVGHSVTTWALRGAFGRFNYIFDNRYIIEFNARYDGTSRFARHDRFAFSPSASAGWVVSREEFFEPITDIVSFLRLRASYGSLGNQDVGAFAHIATMPSGPRTTPILDGTQPTWVGAPPLVAGNLTWERVTTRNVGMDLNFLNNRLTLSADAYIRETSGMLMRGQDLPSVLGTPVPYENAADLETTGWEFNLGWRSRFMLASRPFNYRVNFNLADSWTYITHFANETGALGQWRTGQRVGEIWGLETAGFFESYEQIEAWANQRQVTSYPGTRPLGPGDLKFVDRNNDGYITWGNWTYDDPGDFFIIGNNRARFTFGLSLGADWNGFDFNAFFRGVGRRDYAPPPSDLFFFGVFAQPWTNITYGNYHDRWTPETPNAFFPRFKSYVAEQGYIELGARQTRYLQNAAFIRFKNLTIGYTVPESITRRMNIERLRLFFSGDNLFEWTGLYRHYRVDPEGLGGLMYPFQRYFSFGMNLTF